MLLLPDVLVLIFDNIVLNWLELCVKQPHRRELTRLVYCFGFGNVITDVEELAVSTYRELANICSQLVVLVYVLECQA